jgi:uncharacterized membrane protein YebE (DUF533 family)
MWHRICLFIQWAANTPNAPWSSYANASHALRVFSSHNENVSSQYEKVHVSPQSRGGYFMFDAKRLLFGLLRHAMTGSRPHRVRRGFGRSGLDRMGMGVLGSLAMTALQNYMQRPGPAASGTATTPSPEAVSASDDEAVNILIQAMVAAAKADGEVDPQERQRVLAELTEAGADEEERAFIQHELEKPLDLDALASRVHTPQMAEEVYAASLLAIEVDTSAEQRYLAYLAARLNLDAEKVTQLHERFDAPQPH